MSTAAAARRHRRRPAAGACGLPDDPRRRARLRGGRGGGRWAGRGQPRDARGARRRADGHPHAAPGRHRGDAPDHRQRCRDARPGGDHLRHRRVRRPGRACRCVRVPAQGHPARGAAARPSGSWRPARRCWPELDPAADRAVPHRHGARARRRRATRSRR